MVQYFADRWRDAPTRWRRVTLLISSVRSVLAGAVAEHWRSSLDPEPPAARQDTGHSRGGVMASLLQDIRYALRLLRRQPSFAAFVVLTLAVGIGANTAAFSVVNGVLLRPLPFQDSDRLVAVWSRFDPESGFDFPQFALSPPEFVDYRAQSASLEDVAAWSRRSLTVGGVGAEPERVVAAAVTDNLFRLLRVQPIHGRSFTAEEARPGGPTVAVLSHAYWQSRFGGDTGIVGRAVSINGQPATILGVMAEGFTYPGTTTRIWTPLRIDAANPGNRKAHGMVAIGRLAAGASIESARSELGTLMSSWKAAYPDIHTGHYLFIRPLLEDVSGSIRPALLMLLCATGAVLLIVCANLATVIMARGEARSREMAIRGALGAGKSRLVRLSLIESGVLALLGGTLGVLLAQAGVRALLAIDPGSIPRASEVRLDARMLAVGAGLSVLSALLFGLLPALRGSRPVLQATLKEGSTAVSGGVGQQLARRTLVAIEVALTVVLVVGAGLTLRSFERLLSVDPGFESSNVLMAGIALPAADYKEPERIEAFFDALVRRVRALPGVRMASAASGVPLWNDSGVWDFEVQGRPRPARGDLAWNAGVGAVRNHFFETLGIRLVRGRFFTEMDDARSLPVAVINETMAARFFAGSDPIGQRIRVTGDENEWMTIVGIAADIRDRSLDDSARPIYYFLHSQMQTTMEEPFRAMALLVRFESTSQTLSPAIRDIVRQLDPKLPIYDVQTLDTIAARSVARPRFTTVLLSLFALVAVGLGATGIYGVLAYTVARRTHEIGIRRALGAAPGVLVRDVLVRGMQPVVVGLALGLAASFWTSRLLRSQLFDISPTDRVTYALVAGGVILVSLIACAVPARRALRVNPIVALRAE
jgi:putative ABC transport system permease protein